MDKKRVTILMPVYNGEKFLAAAIESILQQTFKDFEFIIIDDASSDNSFNIIKSYKDSRIRLISNDSNIGQVKTLNRGIRLAESEFVARMDQDDIAAKRRLEKEVNFLLKHDEISAVGTSAIIIDETGRRIGIAHAPGEGRQFKLEILFNNPIFHSSVMLRKEALLEVGCFDENFIFSQDYELWSRMIISGHRLTNIDEPLLFLRKHNSSATVSLFSNAFNIEVPKIIKRNIQSLTGIEVSIQDTERICKVLYAPNTLANLEFENIVLIFEEVFKKFLNTQSRISWPLKKAIAKFRYILALGYLEKENLSSARKEFLQSFKTYPYNFNPLAYYFFILFGLKSCNATEVLKKYRSKLIALLS